MRTQAAIIGAGPAGLLLSHLLSLEGIDSVVLEQRSREYVETDPARIRAGVLEHGPAGLLEASGVGGRMRTEGLVHHGIELRFDGAAHRIPLTELTGRSITVYGQQEVVKDLIAARLAAGGTIVFGAADVRLGDVTAGRPEVRFTHDGREETLECDVIAGCDGFHGASRAAIPPGVLRVYERVYPYAWLGILAAVAPSTSELIYARHERGFALHSLRSTTLSRLYLQVNPGEQLAGWPDDRIWEELQTRLATRDGWTLATGPVLEKSVTAMRSFVAEPMQYGRLFLVGDAAHIVPPTGAKGMNLAVSDVQVLTHALTRWYRSGWSVSVESYSAQCLQHVWRAEDFSAWMTALLHTDYADGFADRAQHARLAYTARSRAATASLAENYVAASRPVAAGTG